MILASGGQPSGGGARGSGESSGSWPSHACPGSVRDQDFRGFGQLWVQMAGRAGPQKDLLEANPEGCLPNISREPIVARSFGAARALDIGFRKLAAFRTRSIVRSIVR